MGAWGIKAIDNDTAMDFCNKLDSVPVVNLIDEGLNSTDYDEQRVAAWLLDKLYDVIDPDKCMEQTELALQKLAIMADDEKWLATWNDPVKTRKKIVKFRRKLRTNMVTNCNPDGPCPDESCSGTMLSFVCDQCGDDWIEHDDEWVHKDKYVTVPKEN